ncbi:ABC transporter ATP-binding protein [Kineococcus rhizosphaerae]|uniref:ATP-binding cassette subfamily B protein n=1 Tax=Kineococcus rhizosphaerae TaxID=559628 RepID=A0A2T0RBC5_9ACTN|nr:ABC transporter ATP-binding protein [Kineococcus rhizosphaerae]PRY18462.1 ATP-binding cassette subfamily B protein [Kineococcus rhizosphaerae]
MSSERSQGWLRRLAGYCARHPRDLIASFGAALVAYVVTALVPLVVRHVVDDVIGTPGASLWPWAALLVAAGLVVYALGFVRRFTAGRLSLDVQFDLRNEVHAAVQRMDGRQLDGLSTGQVVSRSISDVQLVQGLLAWLPNVTGNAVLFVVSLVVMAVLSPSLTLVALATGPALFWIAWRSRRDLFPANFAAQARAAEVAAHVEAAVTGVRVVKGFGQEAAELRRLEGVVGDLFTDRMRVVRYNSRYGPALQAVPALGQVGVLLFGGWLALTGHLTVGTFLAFTTYLGSLVSPVRQLAGLLTMGQQARAGVERVLQVVDTTPTILAPAAAGRQVAQRSVRDLPDGPLAVAFEGVEFGYTPDRPVLHGVDLSVPAGGTLALVGTAGSGKSTLTSLLPRFYDVAAGSVRLGGVDVRDLDPETLRAAVGMVFEETFLFSDTVRANVAYSVPTATDEEVRDALRTAAADGFVDALDQGWDSLVGEQGLTLSGGQRQRIGLARALLARPRVLVLDDATSAVDPTVEQRILTALADARTPGQTVLLVAHRRSTLRLADRIVVLDAGRVVDAGTEAELTERCAVFRRLFDPDETGEQTPVPERVSAAQRPVPAPRRGGRTAAAAAVDAGLPVSGDLLRRIADLPPSGDVPDVDVAAAERHDPAFGLGTLLRPFRWALAAGMVLVAGDALAQLFLPQLVRTGLDDGVSTGDLHALVVASVVAAVVVAADWVVNVGQTRVAGRTGERLLFSLRLKTFAQLQRLGLDYYEREQAGRIMTRMTTDVDALSSFLQNGVAQALVSLLSLVGVFVAMLVLEPELALVVACVLPVLVAATLVFRAKSRPAYTEARERVSAVNVQFQESVAGVRVAQAFGRTHEDGARFRAKGWAYRQARLRAQRYIATYFPFVQFLNEATAALVLVAGGLMVRDGRISVGVLVAFLLYVDLFFAPVQQLSQVFDGYQQAAVGLRRLRDLLRTPTTVPAAAQPAPVGRLAGDLRFEHVDFHYQNSEHPALAALDLHVRAGETVALVGETGAGKSTVVKLVARFYDPTGGRVLVDGEDLRSLDLAGYRQRLGVVPQEAYLFDGTVAEAIAYARPGASFEQVRAAARAVGADAAITALPGGYGFVVGERGRNLSTGQRQLVALARAELVDPDVLLLDEATAALDPAAEAAIAAASDAAASRRTTIVVAHRLSTAARADRIVVLDHGRVVEQGTHADLLDRGGYYAGLWASFVAGRTSTA